MKDLCVTLFEQMRDASRSLFRATSRSHDPLLAQSMASFNFDGGWRELGLKISLRHMPTDSAIALVNEPSGI
ncbi:MAG: hypothetical protein WCE87_07850 [Candidatus Udaeobacter sp.]